ncbi:hypothetical protein DNTS_006738 [Danionella cerebrum]|uniref:Complex I assembly factor TIMMDC1, mitochondrial n=1 Tax=Danionella cerebrum TaxID=2873325 RepID=A0A553QZ86_9TELE|nr:hypothetical protein DNTS_006738 [Danionella translucida]
MTEVKEQGEEVCALYWTPLTLETPETKVKIGVVMAFDGRDGNEPELGSECSSTQTLPWCVGKPEYPDSGWDRVKDVFFRDKDERISDEVIYIVKSGITAVMFGAVYGGMPAAREARKRFIEVSQADVYQHRAEAVRAVHNAAIRGFIRFGFRWGWRVGVFVTLFK